MEASIVPILCAAFHTLIFFCVIWRFCTCNAVRISLCKRSIVLHYLLELELDSVAGDYLVSSSLFLYSVVRGRFFHCICASPLALFSVASVKAQLNWVGSSQPIFFDSIF